jgi:hypothetical protein
MSVNQIGSFLPRLGSDGPKSLGPADTHDAQEIPILRRRQYECMMDVPIRVSCFGLVEDLSGVGRPLFFSLLAEIDVEHSSLVKTAQVR